jgi:general nucleoside transport system ATP-binding protein
VAGVDGNGQRELALVLTGLLPATGGRFALLGADATGLSPREVRARGLAHIPEDRLRHAITASLTVEENASLGRHQRPPFAKGPLVDGPARRAATVALLEAHDVRPRDPLTRMGGLSGGNQQKLVVGRELSGEPKVVVAVQPTRGLDIAAVAAVRRHLLEARARGCAVLLVSLDLDEVLELSDRVVTMYEGRVTGSFGRGELDERVLGRRMLGVSDA